MWKLESLPVGTVLLLVRWMWLGICIVCMWLTIVYCVCMFDNHCVGSSLRSTLSTSHSWHQLYARASTELLFFLYHYLVLLLLLKFGDYSTASNEIKGYYICFTRGLHLRWHAAGVRTDQIELTNVSHAKTVRHLNFHETAVGRPHHLKPIKADVDVCLRFNLESSKSYFGHC